MPRPKRSRDANRASRELHARVVAEVKRWAALGAALEALEAEVKGASAAAYREEDRELRAALVARAEEAGTFRDLLLAEAERAIDARPIKMTDALHEAWDKRWAALRLPACAEWFAEHKRRGSPAAPKIAPDQMAALTRLLEPRTPTVLGWKPRDLPLAPRIERAVTDASKAGPGMMAAELLGALIGKSAKTVKREAKEVAERGGGRQRIPRRLPR